MKKYISVLYACVFAVAFILPTVLFSFLSSENPENYENRNLAEKPPLQLSTISQFPTAYENYYNDNLPFRSRLIESNALLNYHLFKDSPVSKVVIGNDGWLFYNPPKEDSDPIGQASGYRLSDELLQQTAQNLTNMNDWLKERNKDFGILICPNKESVYYDEMPKYYNTESTSTSDQLYEYLTKNTDIKVAHPKISIAAAKKNNPDFEFYYKTDTHWNDLGAYLGAKSLLEQFNITLPDLNTKNTECFVDFSGDLAGMTGIPLSFGYGNRYTINGYPKNDVVQETLFDKVESFKSIGQDNRKVLVIRDSFSTYMYPYFNPEFSNVHFIHITEYYSGVLNDIDPDIVIIECAERYLDRFRTFSII